MDSLRWGRFEQAIRRDELDVGIAGGVIEDAAQDVLEHRIHFPVVGGEAEIPARAARLFKARHQVVNRRAGHQAVATELRVIGVAQHVWVD